MPNATIYYNPKCSTCRNTLQLLQDNGIEPTVERYLESPPDVETLRKLVAMLGIEPAELVRQKDRIALGLPEIDDAEELLQQMVDNPKIIQRPIVVIGDKACLSRPAEQVLNIVSR